MLKSVVAVLLTCTSTVAVAQDSRKLGISLQIPIIEGRIIYEPRDDEQTRAQEIEAAPLDRAYFAIELPKSFRFYAYPFGTTPVIAASQLFGDWLETTALLGGRAGKRNNGGEEVVDLYYGVGAKYFVKLGSDVLEIATQFDQQRYKLKTPGSETVAASETSFKYGSGSLGATYVREIATNVLYAAGLTVTVGQTNDSEESSRSTTFTVELGSIRLLL